MISRRSSGPSSSMPSAAHASAALCTIRHILKCAFSPCAGAPLVQHPRNQVGRGRGAAAGCSSTRKGPPARCHPTRAIAGLWEGRCRSDVRGHRGVMPPRKLWTRAPRIDARRGAEVLAEVEQHVNHAGPHVPRRRERPGVIPVADDLPSAAEGAVDRERQPNRQPVHAAARAPRLIPLDDEVPVVLLDRKMDHPKAIDRGPRDGASERAEHPRRSKRRQSGRCPDVTCTGHRGSISARVAWGIEGRPRGFRPAPLRAPPHVLAASSGSASADFVPI